ncbi:YidH family protein [Methylophaga sp.]|jgi:putative membrane protein|uniref:YidH family protein n=1 Tax=Methylophaga sp. TaxID=2024840 RepID=UPI003A9599CB
MSYLQDPRVLFAAERTLLAWNRTGLTFIMFGFLIERSGLLIEILANGQQHLNTTMTFVIGLAFILLGSFTTIYAARQFQRVLKTLGESEFPEGYRTQWGVIVSLIVALLGSLLAISLFLTYN